MCSSHTARARDAASLIPGPMTKAPAIGEREKGMGKGIEAGMRMQLSKKKPIGKEARHWTACRSAPPYLPPAPLVAFASLRQGFAPIESEIETVLLLASWAVRACG